MTFAGLRRGDAKHAIVSEAAHRHEGHRFLDSVEQTYMHGADGGEISLIREVWPLADIDRFYQFRNQEIQIGITLPMRMRAHVDRHIIHGDR